jgi:hypothetical protein
MEKEKLKNATESIGVTEMPTEDFPMEWEESINKEDIQEFCDFFWNDETQTNLPETYEEFKEDFFQGSFFWRYRGFYDEDGKAVIQALAQAQKDGAEMVIDDEWRSVTDDSMHSWSQEEVEKELQKKIKEDKE